MIGYWSLGSRLAMVVVGLGVAVAASRGLRQQPSAKRVLACLLGGFVGIGMAVQLYFNTRDLQELRRVESAELEAVLVGEIRIDDPGALDELADCLGEATWFDGRRGRARPFHLVRRAGSRRLWEVAPLRDGAVIDFGLYDRTGFRPYRGAAYVGCLPEVLGRYGVALGSYPP